jgi:hypothetical protein
MSDSQRGRFLSNTFNPSNRHAKMYLTVPYEDAMTQEGRDRAWQQLHRLDQRQRDWASKGHGRLYP